MAYDEGLAERVRGVLRRRGGVTEKKMFGGLAFLRHGNMCVGVIGDELMARVGPDAYEDALTRAHARPMDFTGKPMKGLVYVAAAGVRTDEALGAWVDRADSFARTLPRK